MVCCWLSAISNCSADRSHVHVCYHRVNLTVLLYWWCHTFTSLHCVVSQPYETEDQSNSANYRRIFNLSNHSHNNTGQYAYVTNQWPSPFRKRKVHCSHQPLCFAFLEKLSIVHIGNRHEIGHCFHRIPQAKCSAYAILIENMSMTFIPNKLETAMTSHGHVTTASLKQAN